MVKRTLFALIALLLPASTCFAQAEVNSTKKNSPVTYRDLGFKVNIPEPYEQHSLPTSGDTLVSDIYISGNYAYIVKVTNTPTNSIASTAIEQAIQADAKLAPGSTAPKRWEQDSAQKELFKGLTRAYEYNAAAQMMYPFLDRIFRGKEFIQTISMAPLIDETSPIVTLGVIGPKTPDNDVEIRAKDIAFTFIKLNMRPRPTSNPPGMPRQPGPAPSPNIAPPRSTHPTPAKPEARPFVRSVPVAPSPKPAAAIKIKRGDIELVGSVESIAPDRKSLTMLVDQVTLFAMKPTRLNPARQKTVNFDKLANGIRVWSKVRAVGKNEGVGKPITSDVLELAH